MMSFLLFCFIVVADRRLCRLAMVACRQVLIKRQTGYGKVIAWLEQETRKLGEEKGVDVEMLVGVAKAVGSCR